MTVPYKIPNEPVVQCSHCGEACEEPTLIGTEQSFCCQGCKLVYELLQENGLRNYYNIEQTPGLSLKALKAEQYAYLDDPEVKRQFVDYTDGKVGRVRFLLPQIHCASCIWLLEHLYQLDRGIQQSRVNFLKKEVHLSYSESDTSLSKIAGLLHKIGYPPAINLADLNSETPPTLSKSLYYKLGVTGFVFGNIMFMSFPEYLGLHRGEDAFYFHLFGYLNLLFGLPLVFYSGWDYLRSAYLGLRQGNLNIDLPISIGILSLFGRSAFEILSQTGAGYMDSLGGLIFFLLVGKWFQQKTYHSISFERDYQSYFPIAANRLEDNEEQATSLNKLQAGDQIIVRNQELIPADGILQSEKAYIDYSFVTGESAPVKVEKGALLYAGGRQTGAAIQIQLTKKVIQSYLVQLWNEHSFEQKTSKLAASQLANAVGKYFTIAILLISAATLLYWLPIDTAKAINAFSAVLIIACPCAVALSIPFTYGNVLRVLGRSQSYLKNTEVIEQVQRVTHIVFDKTGTLTERQEQLVFEGQLSTEEKDAVYSLACQSTHPRSQQICEYLKGAVKLEVTDFEEIPGEGIGGTIGGQRIYIGKGAAGTEILVDGLEKGYFGSKPQLRKGMKNTLHWLRQQFDISLLSGDHNRRPAFFSALFGGVEQLHFNHSPKEKLQYIEKLQQEGAVVMMVGDGLNDAGALQQANVGLVVTEEQNNFSPACDGVLSTASFQQFPNLINYIRQSRWVIYISYAFALCYNIIGLSYAVQGLLSPVIAAILMPLSSLSIVLLGISGSWWLARRLKLNTNQVVMNEIQ
ncbi:MAG: heavy metal translocating P-type ATPase metal-binding domain-containing protein [Bacteroidota bacterium]